MPPKTSEKEKIGYERFGLRSNPFRDLSSESLENVDIFHVVQDIDENLNRIKEEVFFKENKAFIAILGGLGAGKTERLLLAANEGRKKNAFVILQNMSIETRWAVEGILGLILEEAHLGFFQRLFSSPKWYRNIQRMKKLSEKSYDPERIGRVIAAALNAKRPSILLINDFHHLAKAEDQKQFLHVLHVLADHIEQGVMIMISCDQDFFQNLMKDNASLNQRINRQIIVPPLKNNEACLMLAKRQLEKRLVDDIDPLYPFTPEAVAFLNDNAEGNPRQLLKLADITIDFAAKRRALMIDEEIMREVLAVGKNQQLNITVDEVELEPEVESKRKSGKAVSFRVEAHASERECADSLGKRHQTQRKGGAKQVGSPKVVDMTCPQCNRHFSSVVHDNNIVRCPHCDFIGNVT